MNQNYTNFAIWIVLEEEQRKKQEEEEMAHYSDDEIAGDWEFKIVRSSLGMFKNPAELARLVKEEAEFGWELFEKLDNERVRFKRHVRERSRDRLAGSGRDPYRSTYGTLTIGRSVLLIAGTLLFVVMLVLLMISLA